MPRPKVRKSVAVMSRDGQHIFLNPDKPSWFVGTPKAGDTVRLMDGSRTVEEIVVELAKTHEIPLETLKADAEELVDAMRRKGMLEDSPAEPAVPMPEMKLSMVWLHVTHRCNLRCKYCYITAGDALPDEMSKDEIISLIDQFHAMGGPHQTMALTGGEPLVRQDFWDIVAHARKLGISLLLATNGSLIDEATAKKVRENFRGVQISLDGPREKHDAARGKGSYDGAVRGIRLLMEAGLKPYANAVVTKENAAEMGELAQAAHEIGLESIKSPPLLQIGKGGACNAPSASELARAWWAMDRRGRELKSNVPMDSLKTAAGPAPMKFGYGCGAGLNSISVDADGKVYPCQGAQQPTFLAGSLREKSLAEIWETSGVFAEWRDAKIDKIKGCSSCAWRNYCGGGCRLHAAAAHGTIMAPDRYCALYSRMLEESIWTSSFRKMGKPYDPDELWAKAVADLEAIEARESHSKHETMKEE